ncbi:MAG TPA: PP2C family protein-serine/threonine phosphatase, partial [Actinomycetota bacterium]|nr:PP2C family protein-serine/threonine phosphatase [Actinomycetota bacterium]
RERSVARKLQAGLLTTEMPDLGASEIGAVYEAADDEAEVGGDFYDVIELEDDRFGLVVGDVSGKGAEAAAQTAVVKYMLRAFALRNPAPASALYDLNNALARDLAEDRFVTLMYAVFDPRQRRCSIAVAGHPPPLIYRRDRDEVDQVDTQGPIMGAFEDQRFEHVSAELAGGDVFLAYTDGLLEARSGEEFFGLDRIRSSLQRHARRSHAAEMARHIYEDARRFGQINDDTVVFVLAGKDRS